MIHITSKTFHALIKETKHLRQDGNRINKNIEFSNYIYLCKVS